MPDEVTVQTLTEAVGEYLLSDGNVFTVKLVLTKVFRLPDAADGPSYCYLFRTITNVNKPANRKASPARVEPHGR